MSGLLLFEACAEPASGAGFAGEAGPHHRVMKPAEKKANQAARAVVEVGSGMNYWDGAQWAPSDARFERQPDGAFSAGKVQHKVNLRPNLNRAGAVSITTPDGKVLKSTPVGIRLYDSVSGESMVVGVLKDCRGAMAGSNQVIYSDAFKGICASVLYTIDKGSIQQDVVITSNLDPADFGFPTNSTRIQVMTEFFDGNQPARTVRPLYIEKDEKVRKQAAMPDFIDETLEFGELVFGPGRAFTGVPNAQSVPIEGPVVKEFVKIGQRTFLIESVEYITIKKGLQVLPPCGEQTQSAKEDKHLKRTASVPPAIDSEDILPLPSQSGSKGAILASQGIVPSGVTVDYIATVGGSLSAKVFQGDTTYFLSSPVFCNGATTIEGGVVFKYPNSTGTGAATSYLSVNNSLTVKTTPYRPAYFTAGNDDTVGDKLSTTVWSNYRTDGSGNGLVGTDSYASPAIILNAPYASIALNYCRFRYAQVAIKYVGAPGSTIGVVNHSQFLSCVKGIELLGCGCGCACGTAFPVTLFNCLMSGVGTSVVTSVTGAAYTGTFQDCTIDTCTKLGDGTIGGLTLYVTNCVIANVSSLGTSLSAFGGYNGFYNSTFGASSTFGNNTFTTATSPFSTVGGGSHYLLAASNFKSAALLGGMSAGMQTDLMARTTEPPIQLAVGAGQSAALSAAVNRDSAPFDLGYHYEVLDYLISQFPVPNSGTGTLLTNGAAIGLYGSYGFSVPEGGTVIGEGRPLSMNRLVWFPAVQEQAVALNPASSPVVTPTTAGLFDVSTATSSSSSAVKPVIQLRFTDMPMLGHVQGFFNGTAYSLNLKAVSLQDCWLRGIGLVTAASAVDYRPATAPLAALTNNLVERGLVNLYNGYNAGANNPLTLNGFNNTFWNGTFSLVYNDTSAVLHPGWVLQDNLFDNCPISFTGTGSYLTLVSRTYNGYNPSTATTLAGTSETLLTALTYGTVSAVSWPWYIGSASPTLADVDTTRTGGAAGMYHYTTSTTQTKELNSAMNLGFHYVALVSNLPADSDGDGIPDYLEDRNGDGTYASGDLSNWQSTDTDGDGMPDSWEYLYGLNLVSNDTAGDPDGDGISNLAEYQLGLNPIVNQSQDPASRRNYNYDLLNRLTSVTGKGKVTLSYDKEGNIQTVTP